VAAEVVLTGGLRRFPAAAAAFHLDRGRVRLGLRNPAGARQDFEAVRGRHPDRRVAAVAALELAHLLFADHQEEKRKADGKGGEILRTTLAAAGGGAGAGWFDYTGDKILSSALAAVEPLAAAPAPPEGIHFLRAEILTGLRRYDDAVLSVQDHLRAPGPPADARVFQLHGLLLERRRNWQGAAEAHSKALEKTTDAVSRREIRLARARVLMLSRNLESAGEDYAELLKADRHDLDALCGRAEYRVRRQEFGASLKDVAEIEAHPDVTPRHLCLAARARAMVWNEVTRKPTPDEVKVGKAVARQGYTWDDASPLFLAIKGTLKRALNGVPRDKRAQFWHDSVRRDSAFERLLLNDGILEIESETKQ
jgi:tetratricopeptide (TPR) repeat protein